LIAAMSFFATQGAYKDIDNERKAG
jgi:hypothetical protein